MESQALSMYESGLIALDDGELDAVAGGLFSVKVNLNLDKSKKNISSIGNSTLVAIGENATAAIQVEQSIG